MGELKKHVHPERGPSNRFVEATLTGAKAQTVAPYGPGLALILPCSYEVLDESGEVVADIDVGVAAGRLACTSIRARPGRELTGAFLRGLPVAKWTQEAARASTVRVLRTPRGAVFGARYIASDALGFGDAFRELDADLARTQGGRKPRTLDEQFLSDVATVYREAVARGYPPAKAVEEEFGPTTPENARRWIALARDKGQLRKAPREGQAGEREEDDG